MTEVGMGREQQKGAGSHSQSACVQNVSGVQLIHAKVKLERKRKLQF